MIVRQKHVGWIGVVIDDILVNSTTSIKLSKGMYGQLEETKINPMEAEILLKAVERNHPWAKRHIKLIKAVASEKDNLLY
ncbi:hypothetical protein ACR6HW_05035 [Fusibacter sp. JL298sf-3]